MKKLNEYKVSKNIINRTIKELAFNIVKSYFLRDKSIPMDFSMYYIYDNNSLHMKYYEVKDIFKKGKDLEISFKCIRDNDINTTGGQIAIQEPHVDKYGFNNPGFIRLEVNICVLRDIYKDKRQYQIKMYEIIFHELIHYFDILNKNLKSDNKYMDTLKNLDDSDDAFISNIAPVINQDIRYFLSDEEIRGYATSYYIFGRLKKDYKTTDTYKTYEAIRTRLRITLEYTMNRLEQIVNDNFVDIQFLKRLKRSIFNIKSTKINNIFEKLFYYTELKDKEQVSIYFKELIKIYIDSFKIQLKKADFTFNEYYKKGLRNEKFK